MTGGVFILLQKFDAALLLFTWASRRIRRAHRRRAKAVAELGVLQTLLGGLERIRHGEQHGFFRFAGGIVIIEADDGVAVVVRLKGKARAAVVIGREILRAHPLHFTVVVHAGAQAP